VPYRKATIRPYRPEDESLLFALARDAFGDRPSWNDADTLAALETDTVFVALVEDDPAGYVALARSGDAVRVDQLLVGSRHEHEGVGRQLLEYAEGFAISGQARVLQVLAEEDNVRALDFYRSRGFAKAGAGLLELTLPQR
jgi:ribosomal protein S18 acetylase RimI-like enzyme